LLPLRAFKEKGLSEKLFKHSRIFWNGTRFLELTSRRGLFLAALVRSGRRIGRTLFGLSFVICLALGCGFLKRMVFAALESLMF